MQLEQMQQILLHTYSTDAALRKQAEDAIANLPSQPQSLMLLLQVLSPNQVTPVPREIRQAAAIACKNLIQKQWIIVGENDGEDPNSVASDFTTGIQGYSQNEKQQYRVGVLQCLFEETDTSVRSLLAESFNTISRQDFPARWPSLVDDIFAVLQSADPTRMINALLAYSNLIKLYEYKTDQDRHPLEMIVKTTFPHIRVLFQQLLANNTIEAARMIKLICRAFHCATQFAIPKCLIEDPSLTELFAWIQLFKQFLAKPLPEASENLQPAGQPVDEDERNQWPWWKCKKRVMTILTRFFQRWGNPKNVGEDLQILPQFFRTQVGPDLLGTVLELLALRSRGAFCTDRVLHGCLNWMICAIEPAVTYKLIKPHLQFLLFQVIHPLLMLSKKDLELWQDDPHEFVRKTHDVFEDWNDPVVAGTTLLADLCHKRGKDCLTQVLSFYNEILQSYAAKPVAERKFEDCIQKDGALHALLALSHLLTAASSPHKAIIEPLLRDHVLPEFKSQQGFLRLRACSMFSRHFMDNVVYQDQNTLVAILHGVLQCMQDPELPVRIEAAKTLKSLVVYEESDTIQQALRPILPQVLNQYFELMDEIGNDEVVGALETIIEQFGNEMGPFAMQLVEKMVECFRQFASAAEDDDEAGMTALQCLDAVTTILLAIHGHQELYNLIGTYLCPVISEILISEDGIEYLDSALDMLSSITFYGRGISPALWNLFPLLFVCFESYGWDYISSLVPVIDNYVGRDIETFTTGHLAADAQLPEVARDKSIRPGQSYVEMVFLMINRIAASSQGDDLEMGAMCQLINSVFHNCFNRVDEWVEPTVGILVRLLAQPQTESAQSHFINVISTIMYYNPSLTLGALTKLQATDSVMRLWLSGENMSERAKSVFEKKLLCLGLTAILRLPIAQLPSILAPNVGQIVQQVAHLLRLMLEQEHLQAHGGLKNSTVEAEHNFSSSVPEGGYDSNDDVEGFDEEEYANLLREFANDAEDGISLIAGMHDDEDDYTSQLDHVDPFAFFLDTLTVASNQDTAVYESIRQDLGPNFMTLCEGFSAEAENRRAEMEAAQQQQQ